MKAVMLSIRPKYCELIANGKKTVEVRKTKPKIETPFKCYVYCTKDKSGSLELKQGNKFLGYKFFDANGKVIGEFVCDFVTNYEAELWDDETFERIQEFYEPEDFNEYGEYEYQTLADNSDDFWKEQHLCKASCLSIEELRKYLGLGIHKFYGWHISNLVIYDKPKELSEFERACPYNQDCWKCKYYDNGSMYEPPCCNWEDFELIRPPQSWCYVEDLEDLK